MDVRHPVGDDMWRYMYEESLLKEECIISMNSENKM